MADEWITVDRGYSTACHIWSGATSGHYGWDSENRTFAHRTAWVAENGQIPERMHIHHLCGSKRCVNVSHLELRTPEEHRSLHQGASGRRNRLSEDAVLDIRNSAETLAVVAERYGISKAYASKVRRGFFPEGFRIAEPLPAWSRGRPNPPRRVGRLTPEDIDLIRSRTMSLTELSEMFGMSRTYLAKVRTGKAPRL